MRIPNLHTEISYMNQGVVDYGTRGSVRYDVVLTNSDFEPIMAWDFKTGSATLTDRRIRKMRNMSDFSDLPIYAIYGR